VSRSNALTARAWLGTNIEVDKRIRDLVKFEIKEKSDSHLIANFEVNENLPSFEGHFPGNPILPAVSIIDISFYLLENICPNITYNKIEMKRSKFISLVQPNHTVEVNASTDNGKDWKLLWTGVSNQEKLAQLHLVLPDS
jgi:hypothetical protein